MKKIMVVIIALVFLGLSHQVFAHSLGIGVSLNYFAMNDSMLKEIYPAGSLMFSVSMNANLIKRFDLRAEVNYFSTNGEMSLSKEEVTFTFTPIIVGLRFRIFDFRKISPYLGVGIDFCSYKEKVPERFGGDITGSKTGFHGELGIYVKLSNAFLIDINGRYLSLKAEPIEEVERELGGFRAGMGVEFWF